MPTTFSMLILQIKSPKSGFYSLFCTTVGLLKVVKCIIITHSDGSFFNTFLNSLTFDTVNQYEDTMDKKLGLGSDRPRFKSFVATY